MENFDTTAHMDFWSRFWHLKDYAVFMCLNLHCSKSGLWILTEKTIIVMFQSFQTDTDRSVWQVCANSVDQDQTSPGAETCSRRLVWSGSTLFHYFDTSLLINCSGLVHYLYYTGRTGLIDFFISSYGPRQANLVLIAKASSEGSDEPAHPRSLARTFAARSYKQWVKRNLQTESQIPGPSEWLGMCS